MKSYFEVYNNPEEKDNAIKFPDKYAFWICYFDADLKHRVWLDHRLVPYHLVKTERHFKEYLMVVTVTLHTSVYKFHMDVSDFTRMQYDRGETNIIPPDPPIVQEPFKERKFNYFGLAKSRLQFIEAMNKLFNEGLSYDQAEIQYPGWKKTYYPHIYK